MGYQRQQGPIYCRYCEANQIKTEIAFSKLQVSESGKSIPLDKSTMKPHQCPYSPYARKQDQVQDERTFKTTSAQQQSHQKVIDTALESSALIAKIDNLNIAIAKVMSMVETFEQRNNVKFDFLANLIKHSVVGDKDIEIAKLRQQVTELEEVVKKREDNFVPANQVQSDPEQVEQYDQHVRDMVKKGEEAEELEI